MEYVTLNIEKVFIYVTYDESRYTIVFSLIQRSFCRIQNLNTQNIKKVWGGVKVESWKMYIHYFSTISFEEFDRRKLW